MSGQDTIRGPYLAAVAHNSQPAEERARELSADERAELLLRYGNLTVKLVKMSKLLSDNPNSPQAPQISQTVTELRNNLKNLQLRIDAAGIGSEATAYAGALMAQLYQLDPAAASKSAAESASSMRQQYLNQKLEPVVAPNAAWAFNRSAAPEAQNQSGGSPQGVPPQPNLPGFTPGSVAERLYQYKASRQQQQQGATLNQQDRLKNQAPANHGMNLGVGDMANSAYNRMQFQPVPSGPAGAIAVVTSMMIGVGFQALGAWFTNAVLRGGDPWVGPLDE